MKYNKLIIILTSCIVMVLPLFGCGIQSGRTEPTTVSESAAVSEPAAISNPADSAELITYVYSTSASLKAIDVYSDEPNNMKIPDHSILIDEQCSFYDKDGNTLDFHKFGSIIYENNTSGVKCRILRNNKGFAIQIDIL